MLLLMFLTIICGLLYLFTMAMLAESLRNQTWDMRGSNVGNIFLLNRVFKWATIIFMLSIIIKLII